VESSHPDLVRLGAATTVPLRRLGALLRSARTDAGASLADIAARSEGTFTTVDLIGVESGEHPLSDGQVTELLTLYAASPGDLLASRSTLIIDLDEGTVAAGSWSTSFDPGTDAVDDVLARYLALLYEMRDLAPGTPIPLRTLDVSVLASALAMPATVVEERLEVLMAPGDGRVERVRRLLGRRMLVPAAGLVVAATTAGVLMFVQGADRAPGAELGRMVGATAGMAQVVPELDVAPAPSAGIGAGAATSDGSTRVEAPSQVAPPTGGGAEVGEGLTVEAPAQVAPPGADEPEVGEGLTVEAPAQVAPPGADEPEIGEGLTIERSDIEP
jgi:hypothetical protein